MAIRPVLKMGDARLWSQAQPVAEFDTPQLHRLVADMQETMRHLDGAGLAAPQIGVGLRVMVFGFESHWRYPAVGEIPSTVLINPTLTVLSPEIEEDWEGCLSLPGLRGRVPRWRRLCYAGFDPSGQLFERTVEGFHARLVQHEYDHLDGVLYPMRIRDLRAFGFADALSMEHAS